MILYSIVQSTKQVREYTVKHWQRTWAENVMFLEFTQGMILPTANGVSKPQSSQASQSSQSKTTLDKTQVSYHDNTTTTTRYRTS